MVGVDFGQILCMGGQKKLGIAVLERSRDGLVRLGRAGMAAQVQGLIDKIKENVPGEEEEE